ncbi:MAG TPA: response regulator [Candidatus Dormibacteraeota bacterium]|nr:response regulator [Candidatus Dormibacteraeota bacterium]
MTSRIAVIDDEAPNRAYLQTLLGTAGFDVQVAAGGNEGVALVEKERPDLVLVDLMMPGVDGFMVCERIRKGPAGADVQIVVLSAADGLDGKVRALELGADDYLVKPVESRELVSRINAMLESGARLRLRGSQARGRLTVVAGAKGGIGTSSVAMNLAALHASGKGADTVVLADLAVPVGTLGSMLNIEVPHRWAWGEVLNDGAASAHRLSNYLMRNPQVPLRLLPGVRQDSAYRDVPPEAISSFATSLRGLAATIVVDLGNQPSPFAPPLLREADVILVVVEPEIICVELTRQFLDRLRETGILSHRIRLVICNAHGSLQLSRTETAAALKMEVAAMILYQRDEFSAASKRRLPIVIHHPQSQATTQFSELMQALAAV